MVRQPPRYDNFRPSSEKSSRALSGSKSSDTKPEILLRSAIWRLGLRFRKNARQLPGKPDVVFSRERIAVFCDGDFWHGRNWRERKNKLEKGANSAYWIPKIQANIDRDRVHNKQLRQEGWTVIRVWETDIIADPMKVAVMIADLVASKRQIKR